MNLTDRLRALGTRLGLVRLAAPVVADTPAKIVTRAITLADLRTEIHGDRVAALAPPAVTPIAQDAVSLDVPFTVIDEAAGVAVAAHGWTAERVATVMRSPELAGAPRATVQQAVLDELARAGAPPEDIVRDALARDQAVDAYAAATRHALAARCAQRRKRCAEIAALMTRYQQEMADLDRQDAIDRDRWTAWWATKQTREETLAAAVDALLDQPVVTVDREIPPIL